MDIPHNIQTTAGGAMKAEGNASPQNIVSDNGVFYILDEKGNRIPVDLGTILMMLQLDRTSVADRQIADMLGEINDRNRTLKIMTELMAEMRKLKGNRSGDAQITINGVTKYASAWMKDMGMPWTEVSGNDSEKDAKWDANIQTVKGRVDMMNNDSQMANIRLQNLVEKRNNAFEMASKVMATNNQSIQSTIRNL